MFNPLKINLRLVLIVAGLFLVFANIHAGYLKIEPAIIDEKGNPREIFEETIILTNDANYKTNIYATVHNLDTKEGEQEFYGPAQADLTKSLANWIEINRGVIQLLPGEKKSIDFLIKAGPRAVPGIYHASIAFYEGSDRIEAEKRMAGPEVLVNVEIAEKNDEFLRLKKFAADKTFSLGFPVSFTYELENSGVKPIKLKGELMIFNRRGEEAGLVPISEINAEKFSGQLAVSPHRESRNFGGAKSDLAGALANLSEFNKDFGRYKAILSLKSENGQVVQDTAFFWVISRPILAGLILIICAMTILTIYLFLK
ncbi:MAG: hypothetical protein HYY86_00480 [Candidatus Harrisonbacteria bacterium]|nr:hypothetical protein [Candidatus Harrisonbacteria bacterium]